MKAVMVRVNKVVLVVMVIFENDALGNKRNVVVLSKAMMKIVFSLAAVDIVTTEM